MTFKKYIYDSEASHDFIKDGKDDNQLINLNAHFTLLRRCIFILVFNNQLGFISILKDKKDICCVCTSATL